MTRTRKSGIELLKVFAVIMIVMSHAIPFTTNGILADGTVVDYMLNLNLATENIQIFICNLIRYGGQLGNAIFIVCSAWFLIDSKGTKFEKIFNIIVDSFLISLSILLIYSLLGFKLNFTTIIKQLMPITMKNNWYVTCYLLFYLIHPLLNIIIKEVNQKQLFYINFSMFGLYSVIGSIFLESYFYTQLIGFIEIYFIVAYVKLYMKNFTLDKKKNILILIISSISYFLLIALTNILGLHISLLSDKMLHWCYFYNPFILAISISLFNLFKNFDFSNKFINYLSSLSLYVYIIHTNNLYVRYTFLQSYSYILKTFSFKKILLIVLIYGVCLFSISYVLAVVYNFCIRKLRGSKLYEKFYNLIINFSSKFIGKMYLITK